MMYAVGYYEGRLFRELDQAYRLRINDAEVICPIFSTGKGLHDELSHLFRIE